MLLFVSTVIAAARDHAAKRVLDLSAALIPNRNTQMAYTGLYVISLVGHEISGLTRRQAAERPLFTLALAT